MKENNNFDFDKAFLIKGANILYPIISIFCWFFYVVFFGQGMEFQILDAETPNWPFWFLLSCLSFILISIWCYFKGMINKRLIAINSFVYSLSFFMIEYKLYHILLPLIYVEIVICLCCIIKAFRTPINIRRNWIWLYPIGYIAIYYMYPTILEVIITTGISLVFLTFHESKGKRTTRCALCGCALVVYIVTSFIYCPYNPLLSYKNIQSVNVSYNPRGTSLVVKANNKYTFIDGLSLTGNKLINAEFDTVAQIKPFISLFGGYKINNLCNVKSFEQIPSELFPVIIRGKYAFFSSQKSVYDVLDNCIHSKVMEDSLTAKLYYDYINLCSNNNPTNQEIILKDGSELQNIILKSLNVRSIRNESQSGAEITLRQLSKTISLGMLNALSMDLFLTGDYTSALKIYSYQFFLTFYETDIYKQINTNFNINLNKTYGTEQTLKSYHIKDADLAKLNTFEPWTQIFSMSVTLSEALIAENCTSKQIETIKQIKELIEMRPSFNILNQQSTIQFKKDLNEIVNSLSDYRDIPNLTLFTSQLQQFFYSCVIVDIYPDYNSYFLNRFNEVSPMIPLNPLSQNAYKEFKELYNSRFDKDIKEIKEIASLLGELQAVTDSTISRQNEINQIIKDALSANSMSK